MTGRDNALKPIPQFDFEAMKNVDIRTVDPASLKNLLDVNIDINQPFINKAYSYLLQIENAYCFRVNDVIVKISHSDTTTTIHDCMEGFYRSF
jgi:hypothetical protein